METAKDLVETFNDKELIAAHKTGLSLEDYQLFLLAHLILFDLTNARFLWKRIPKSLKESGQAAPSLNTQVIQEIWAIGKSLTLKEYGAAFSQIRTLITLVDSDSEKNQFATISGLLRTLEKVLREHHVFSVLRKTYATVEFTQFKEVLGFTASQATDASIQEFMRHRELTLDGSYVVIPSKIRSLDSAEGSHGQKQFHLSEERMQDLARVVQYLEKNKLPLE